MLTVFDWLIAHCVASRIVIQLLTCDLVTCGAEELEFVICPEVTNPKFK